MRRLIPVLFVILGLGLGFVLFNNGAAGQADLGPTAALGSGFTYQGRLEIDGAPADGSYDFQFKLFDAATGGNQIGSTVNMGDVVVSDGLFTVLLDFGSGAFAGQARWLQLAVREGSSTAGYSQLSPRQQLTAAPYALHAAQAGSVNWGRVQNRPAGLDDGDDDTTYTAGAGLALAGTHFSAQGSPYANVLVVAQSGGDFASIQAAMDSIGDAGADNPYLVYVAPGVYNETVTLKPYVTVEGAGEGTTIIRGTGGSQSPTSGSSSATLLGADNAALRHLTVESDGTGQDYAVAIHNDNASPTIAHVAARAEGGALFNYGLYNDISSPLMSNVTATASDGTNNYGVYNNNSSPTMTNVSATVSGGTYGYAVFNSDSSPTMTNVTATASGASNGNVGVVNGGSSPVMDDVTATASGGNFSYGVYNASSSSPAMNNVTATASDGTNSYAVYNNNSSPTMTSVTATASGGTNLGVYNSSSSPTIRDSVLEGSDASIYRNGGTVKVANSQLIGPLSTGLTCFHNYDGNLAAITCP